MNSERAFVNIERERIKANHERRKRTTSDGKLALSGARIPRRMFAPLPLSSSLTAAAYSNTTDLRTHTLVLPQETYKDAPQPGAPRLDRRRARPTARIERETNGTR